VASITKVAVGLSAMLLREEGAVDLDADIGGYWGVTARNPAHPDVPITVRSLLSHTSSIFNAGDDTSRSYSSVRAKLQGGGYSGVTPGKVTSWTYNNYAFGVLGMTLELAADRTLDQVLRSRLLDVMNIDAAFASGDIRNTGLLATIYSGGTATRSIANLKSGHSRGPGETGAFFAGGLTISTRDLGKLVSLLAGDGVYEGVRLMEAESVALMETRFDQPLPDGSYQALPLRFRYGLYGRDGIYYHTGSAYGVFNCVSYDPATGDGTVVLTTGASGAKDDQGIYKICSAVNNAVYPILAGGEAETKYVLVEVPSQEVTYVGPEREVSVEYVEAEE